MLEYAAALFAIALSITGAFPANRSTRSANISLSVLYSNDRDLEVAPIMSSLENLGPMMRGLGAALL